jgi:hypothetical protein
LDLVADHGVEDHGGDSRPACATRLRTFEPFPPRRSEAPGPARFEARAWLRQFGLSQFLNWERRPATATVPQPRHHIATIAKFISANETNEGPGVFLLAGRLVRAARVAQRSRPAANPA